MNTIINNALLRPARHGGSRLRRSRLSWLGGLAAVGLALLSPAQGQGLETFDNSNATGSYANGSFVGEDGITWTYVHSRDEGTYGIDGPGIMLRRADEPSSLSANIPGGIGDFSVDTRKAFTGGSPRKIELVINGSLVSQFEPTFGSGADTTVAPFVVNDINVAGTVALELRVYEDGAQITLDNLSWTGFSTGSAAPTVSAPTISELQDTEVTLSSVFFANDGADFTEYGFVIAENAVNSEPSLGDLDVDVVDFPGTPSSPIAVILSDLTPETEYAVRAYVIFDSGAETIYSPTATTFTTLAPPPPPEPAPTLDGVTDYTQDFSGFVSAVTLPTGWSVDADGSASNRLDFSAWADDATGIKFSSDTVDVLGYQHAGSTGTTVKSLTLINDTGAILDELTIAYSGRVTRTDQGRSPAYTVAVNDIEVPALAYSTATNEDNAPRSGSITGLNVAPGGEIVITWTSDGSTAGSPGSGSRKQIGISDVTVATGASAVAPALTAPTVSLGFDDELLLSQTTIGVDATIIADGGSAITERGFVLAPTSLQALPTLATDDTTVIVFDELFVTPGNEEFFFADFEGLSPSTSYSIRAYATNAVGTTFSGSLTQSTLSPSASLTGAGYAESFLGFTGLASLPDGWSAGSSGGVNNLAGDWGFGSAGGFRGPEDGATVGVIGYQHVTASGILTISLEMTNDTGAEITALEVSYLGRVERTGETRLPIWTVEVDGVEVPALSYSTGAGVDQTVSTTVTGLSIASGATFTISWSSDRGEPSDASRQIGLADVTVDSVTVDVTAPVFDLAPGTYFEDQTVFVSNFASLGTGVEVRYTLDGSDPAAGLGSLYDDGTGILIGDGNGAVQLRAISVDTTDSSVSPIVPATYTLPINVADIAALRASSTGGLYRVTGEITFTGGDSFRGTKFFQDTSGFGIQIDDNSSVISTSYAAGDNIAGFVGTLGAFRNQLQWVPAFDPGAPVSTDNSVTPVVRTLDTLSSDDQALLVRINGVEFESAGEFFGGGGQGTNITDPSVSGFVGRYRNIFGDSDISGAEIPSGVVDLIAIVQQRNADFNVAARSLADIIDGPILGDAFDDFVAVAPEGEREISDAPAGDGVANLFKYAFGGSPIVSDRSKLPVQSIVEDSGESYLGISFTPDRNFTWDAQSGTFTDGVVTLTVESSTDLSQGSWSPATGMVLVGGGTELTSGQAVTLRLSTAIDSQTAPRAFLRISGERVPAPL